jgi:hypothetical protein
MVSLEQTARNIMERGRCGLFDDTTSISTENIQNENTE